MDSLLLNQGELQEILDSVMEMDIPDLEKKGKQEALEILITLAMSKTAQAQLLKLQQARPTTEEARVKFSQLCGKGMRDCNYDYQNCKDLNQILSMLPDEQAIEQKTRREIGEWLEIIDKQEPFEQLWEETVDALKSGKQPEQGGKG